MGGAGASKPMVNPPRDWEPKGGTKSFEVISPCSDISNPSDFNRVRYNKNSRQYQLTQGNRHPSQDLSGFAKSKKSGDYNPHQLPVAMKVRRSNSTAGNSNDDIIAPGSFYFPTKESERKIDTLAKQESKRNDGKIVFKRTNSNYAQATKGKKGKMKSFRSLARKTAKKVQKRKETMKRIALALGHACLDESRNKFMMEKENSFIGANQRPEMESSRRTADRKNNTSLRSRRRSEQIAFGDIQASNRSPVPLSQFKKDGNKKKDMVREKSAKDVERQQEMDRVTALALHQADVYFDRLSLENTGQSPFVARGAPDNRITSILQSSSKTPKSSSRRPASESPIDTPVSDLFSAHDSVPEMRDNEYAKNTNDSPVSSLMLFYTKSGPLDSTPKSYCSDGDDAQRNEDSRQRQNVAKSSRNIVKPSMKLNRCESQDSGSSLYTNESKSYKKVNGKNLKLLSHNGHQNALPIVRAEKVKTIPRKTNKPNVSKLESLFRPPIMSALSTDDAQSMYSYDPYEIKVTESAPGAIQAVALGFRKTSPRNADDDSHSAARLSMDSQRERLSIGKSMVSNQARNNADFLFTGDYGPIVRTKKPAHDDATIVSISTAGSRSRLAPKVKGVSIPTKNSEKDSDDVSFDSRSTRSERRVRFSEGSFRTRLMKQREEVLDTKEHPFDEAEIPTEERDDSTIRSTKSFESTDKEIEEDEELYKKFVKKPNTSYHKFGSNVTRNVARVNSVDESIDLPEIENTGSNLSESTSNSSRKSFESAPSVRSNPSMTEAIPEEEDVQEEEEDMMTVMSRDSVHWTKTQTGVTPFVRGKANAIPTKSPYHRYKDAMNQFKPKTKLKTEDRVVPKKATTPQKTKLPKKSPSKSPKHVMRKGSGGLVSLRIQELNTRVSEERKLKRMRKKTTNPRLHTHNFDNTQLPVRSQGLNTYKTNIGSANIQKSNNMMAAKFNMIPADVYEDDDDSTILPANTSQLILSPAKENIEDDDVLSKMSEMTGNTMATVRQLPRGLTVPQSRESVATVRQERNSVATVRQLPRGLTVPQQRDSVATVRQERNVVATMHPQRDSYEGSTTSRSTTSSGLSRLKKQVFRNSDAASISENTTLSAMIQKENDENTMLAPPLMGTPAMKWRTLAAKAAEKDALKTSSTKPSRKMKGLGNRNMNVQQSYGIEKDVLKTNSRKVNGFGARNMNVQQSYEIYGFKD